MKSINHYILLAILAFTITNLNASSPPEKTPLVTSNHVLKIEGCYLDLKPLDITMIGCGPEFVVTLAEPIGRIAIELTPLSSGKFCVEYSITFNIESKIGSTSQYRDSSIEGKAIIENGKSIQIVKIGDHALTLSVSDPKE